MAAIIPSSLPAFSYTGAYTTELRDDWGWVIRFTSGGVLRFEKNQKIDVHLLGGGGEGGGADSSVGGGGGGGWQTIKKRVEVKADTPYTIVVGAGGASSTWGGADGGASSAFGLSAEGGKGGGYGDSNDTWASGGSGGTGNGGPRGYAGGSNTVREFGETSTSWPVYGGGGGAGGESGGSPYGGGSGSAAKGYGGGGGGHNDPGERGSTGGDGYQGIVSIRNSEVLELPVKFDGTTLVNLFFNGSEVKHLIHDGAQLFMEKIGRWFKRFGQRTRFAWHAG